MHYVKCNDTEDEAIDFIYPNGHDPILMQNQTILAATNKSVNEWNSKIQVRSGHSSTLHSLYSVDKDCKMYTFLIIHTLDAHKIKLNNFDDSGDPRDILGV